MPTIIRKNRISQNGNSEVNVFSHQSSNSMEGKHFIEESPRWTLDEIVLNPQVKDTLEDFILFCQNKNTLIEKWGLNEFLKGTTSIGINLYGEPGTGKSISAEAIAHSLGKKIIMADFSELIDKHWGNTEKHLTALFKQAEESDCVIFIEEADGLLGQRSGTDSNSSAMNGVKAHLLKLIDRSSAIIIYATNLFENFDRAFFRRILYHVKYPLPNKDELISLWKKHIGNHNIPKSLSNFSYEDIAEMSNGLSGGDIKNITLKLCVKLASNKIQDVSNDSVRTEIEKYKKSLEDSKKSQAGKILTQEEIDELKREDPKLHQKMTDDLMSEITKEQ